MKLSDLLKGMYIITICIAFIYGIFLIGKDKAYKESIKAGVGHYVFDDNYGNVHFEFITNNITTNKYK